LDEVLARTVMPAQRALVKHLDGCDGRPGHGRREPSTDDFNLW
jgi:hypothetical protein